MKDLVKTQDIGFIDPLALTAPSGDQKAVGVNDPGSQIAHLEPAVDFVLAGGGAHLAMLQNDMGHACRDGQFPVEHQFGTGRDPEIDFCGIFCRGRLAAGEQDYTHAQESGFPNPTVFGWRAHDPMIPPPRAID
jgi:hypothetical protein